MSDKIPEINWEKESRKWYLQTEQLKIDVRGVKSKLTAEKERVATLQLELEAQRKFTAKVIRGNPFAVNNSY